MVRLAKQDPDLADAVRAELRTQLSASNYREVSDATPGAALRVEDEALAKQGVSKADRAAILDMVQMGFDVAGIFDPTPVSDGISGAIALSRGDWLGAGISAVSMVPYVGDLAKAGKIGRWAQTVANGAELVARYGADSAVGRKALAAMGTIGGAIDAIPGTVLDKLPARTKAQLEATKATVDGALGRAAGKADEAAGAALNAVQRSVGRNAVEWTTDAQGRLVSASATLKDVFKGLPRSADEVAAQTKAATKGIDGDHGGHAVAHRFVGDQGEINMFPQNGVSMDGLKNFNGSAYKSMENELADWVEAGGTVKLDIGFDDFVGDRPGTVAVQYVVTNDAGKAIYENDRLFDNVAGQTFNRASKADIAARLAGADG